MSAVGLGVTLQQELLNPVGGNEDDGGAPVRPEHFSTSDEMEIYDIS